MIQKTKKSSKIRRELERGVPIAIYHRIRRAVLRGELTWDEAVSQGLCEEPGTRGRPRLPLVAPKISKPMRKKKPRKKAVR